MMKSSIGKRLPNKLNMNQNLSQCLKTKSKNKAAERSSELTGPPRRPGTCMVRHCIKSVHFCTARPVCNKHHNGSCSWTLLWTNNVIDKFPKAYIPTFISMNASFKAAASNHFIKLPLLLCATVVTTYGRGEGRGGSVQIIIAIKRYIKRTNQPLASFILRMVCIVSRFSYKCAI